MSELETNVITVYSVMYKPIYLFIFIYLNISGKGQKPLICR